MINYMRQRSLFTGLLIIALLTPELAYANNGMGEFLEDLFLVFYQVAICISVLLGIAHGFNTYKTKEISVTPYFIAYTLFVICSLAPFFLFAPLILAYTPAFIICYSIAAYPINIQKRKLLTYALTTYSFWSIISVANPKLLLIFSIWPLAIIFPSLYAEYVIYLPVVLPAAIYAFLASTIITFLVHHAIKQKKGKYIVIKATLPILFNCLLFVLFIWYGDIQRHAVMEKSAQALGVKTWYEKSFAQSMFNLHGGRAYLIKNGKYCDWEYKSMSFVCPKNEKTNEH